MCPLYSSVEGPVWGEGPKDAQLMFVGEAPGEDEGLALKPFVGGSGRVFNAQLNHAGISRQRVYVTNTVKCRPTARGAQGRIVNRQPTETEIRCCAKFLLAELESVSPNTVVALGNVPMKTLTGTTKGITTVRSVPLDGPKRRGEAIIPNGPTHFKIVGTIHPAAIMRQQGMWPAVIFDLVRARTESAFPAVVRRPWKHHIHASLADHGERLRRQIQEGGVYGGRFMRPYHHDLETTGLDPRTSTFRCIGIAARSDEVFCFDWTGDVIEFVKRLHADAQLTTVGQNSEGFDIPYQEGKGFLFEGPSYDTMIGHHLLNPDLPKDLGFIGASVTDEPYWKDNSMYKAGEDALQLGCCKDIHATARAFETQHEELQELGQMDLYYNHIMPLQPVLRRMTRRGLRKDQRAMAGWHSVLNRKADEMEVRLKKGLGDATFEINSPKQLMDLLYTRMGLPVQYKQDSIRGLRPTVDADALDALVSILKSGKYPQHAAKAPILLLVRGIRTLRKWDATFVMADQDAKGFVHGKFSSAKAANGRLNSFDPNMQNYPVDIRGIMIPDTEDHVLLARDWGQIEWRIAMALSGDKAGLDALAAGRDAHQDAYAQAFLKAYEDVDKAERDIAKAVNYGMLYGRGNESIAAGRAGHPEDQIPLDRVVTYSQGFMAKFTGYRAFRSTIEHQVRRNHFVATAWGRRRWWFTTQNMPEAFNYPISGAAAHMMYEVLVELENQLPVGATLRLTVHDEVVICSLKDQKVLQQAIDCSREVMERAFPQIMEASLYPDVLRHYYPNGWSCPSDAHIGTNWKMTKGKTKDDVLEEKKLLQHLGVAI